MDKVKVLVIEDTKEESDSLTKVLADSSYEVTGVATTFKDAISLFYSTKPDIAIVDIFLYGNPEGITFAETINAVPGAARPFIFLTSSNDRQLFERAKLTHPFSYLMKPFNELEVLYAIEMAVEKFYGQQEITSEEEANAIMGPDYLFVKKNKALKKVTVTDILYIEVEERYCNIVTTNEKFVIMISLQKISELLDSSLFVRTHRNYIVNLTMIEEIIPADNLIVLKGNHRVNLSEKYKDFIKRMTVFK